MAALLDSAGFARLDHGERRPVGRGVAVLVPSHRRGAFRLQAPSSWSYLSSLSAPVSTLVRWRVSASFKDATVTRGTTVRLTGKVSPVRSGTAVRRQRLVNGAWTTVASGKVRSDGTYLFSFTWRTRGTYTYRVVAPGTALNTTGYSTTLRLRVS